MAFFIFLEYFCFIVIVVGRYKTVKWDKNKYGSVQILIQKWLLSKETYKTNEIDESLFPVFSIF